MLSHVSYVTHPKGLKSKKFFTHLLTISTSFSLLLLSLSTIFHIPIFDTALFDHRCAVLDIKYGVLIHVVESCFTVGMMKSSMKELADRIRRKTHALRLNVEI